MVLAIALLLVALFAYAAVQTAAQSYALSEERHRLELELWELRRQHSELEGLVAYLGSEEYVEGVARQQLGLVREGEIAVLIDAPEDAGKRREPGERWWEALFGR
jgi:cell division protein FtsB